MTAKRRPSGVWTGGSGIPDVSRGVRHEVRPSAVKCPTCGAEPGERCVTTDGAETSAHRYRRVKALREGNFIASHYPACSRCGRRMKDGSGVISAHSEPGSDIPCHGRTAK